LDNRLFEKMRGEVSDRVIEALIATKRELFLPSNMRAYAYEDRPLPIGSGQTISAPHMVAIMCEVLDIREGMKVLDIGTGCGYHAAVMARLVGPKGRVHSVERLPDLAARAKENLVSAGISNVHVIVGDGSLGLPEHAPFDRINVAASAPSVPAPLLDQLAKGGRMAIPVGAYSQDLILITRNDGFEERRLMGVIFVPLIGAHGFRA
jgi:protein-L-isoaspartate(D-aspartate) O-methyltransferase